MAKRPTSIRHKRMRSAIISGSILSFLPILSLMQTGSGSAGDEVIVAEAMAPVADVAAQTTTTTVVAATSTTTTSSTKNTTAATATPTTTTTQAQAQTATTYTRSKAS